MDRLSATSLDDMRNQVLELHVAGRLKEAIQLQIAVVNVAVELAQIQAEDYHRLGVMLFVAKDFPTAVTAFEHARRHQPNFPGIARNLGLSLTLTGRFQEAVTELHRADAEKPDNIHILAGLAHAYGRLNELDKARIYGERSLLLKDRFAHQSPPKYSLVTQTPPPFRIDRPHENVIAFSLFGTQDQYLRGAVKNAIIASGLYPGWQCRFYCDDTVPVDTRTALTEAGAEIKMMPPPLRPTDGLFWRFLVMDDPTVVRFLVRDCDSVINIRERRAVDEWLASQCCFHIMRDHPAHTDLILAGLWGGVARLLPPLPQLLEGFHYQLVTESRTADQLFLGQVVWPLIKSNCLIHDSVYRVFGAKDFPGEHDLPPGRYVGDNDASSRAVNA